MAKQENLDMEKDKKLLQAILDSLQSDDLWDENIPREKALKEMKEPRYHYMKKNMTISGTKSNEKDTVMAGGDFKKTDAQNMLKDQTGDSVHIKVENPQLVSFRQDLAVLRSGKTRLEKEWAKAKDILLKIQEKNPTIGSELTTACGHLATTIEDLRIFIHASEKIEEPNKDDSSKLAGEIEKNENHLDAFKRLVQKKKTACD